MICCCIVPKKASLQKFIRWQALAQTITGAHKPLITFKHEGGFLRFEMKVTIHTYSTTFIQTDSGAKVTYLSDNIDERLLAATGPER